jgi:hypothetical protein
MINAHNRGESKPNDGWKEARLAKADRLKQLSTGKLGKTTNRKTRLKLLAPFPLR